MKSIMTMAIRSLLFSLLFGLVLCNYCHLANRRCPKPEIIHKLEVLDPQHCQQECDIQKEKGCRAVEYFKGVCTVLRGSCNITVTRSPDTHYFYKSETGKCIMGNDRRSHVNLALKRPAYQSDSETKVIPLGRARYAVDGNNDQDYAQRSCSQTMRQKAPYWFVDLGGNYTVTSVSLTNRKDRLGGHLRDFAVFVLHERPNKFMKPRLDQVCVYRNETFMGEQGFHCDKPRTGRYVVVQLLAQSGRPRVLSLCEVEVFSGVAPQGFVDGDAYDLARGRPAFQIATAGIPIKPAYLALDGNPDRNLTRGHCAATDWIPNPWWAVDLQSDQWVKGVRLVNRADCCADRLSNVLIAVTQTRPRVGELYRQTLDEECVLHRDVIYDSAYLDCQEPILGRYVMVIVQGSYIVNRQLSLCEVNVYAKY